MNKESKKQLQLSMIVLLFIALFAVGCNNDEDGLSAEDYSFITENIIELDYEVYGDSGIQTKAAKNMDLSNLDQVLLTIKSKDNEAHSIYSHSFSIESALFDMRDLPREGNTIVGFDIYNSEKQKLLILDPNFELPKLIVEDGSLGVSSPVRLLQNIESIPFDWERSMHVSNNSSLPRLPWISGASTGVSRDIALDYKRSDGWVLLHNSFNLVSGNNEPRRKYMLFYNKYTGFLRMWYWHEGESAFTGLKYAIQVKAKTSMLNFNTDFAKPMDERVSDFYAEYVSGNPNVPSSQGLTNNTWYMFEYEIAYDDNVANISRAESDVMLSARGVNITDLKLSGTQFGKINGTIMLNAPGTNLFNGKFNFNSNGDGANKEENFESAAMTTRDEKGWWNQIKWKVTEETAKSIGSAAASLGTKVLNLATNPVGNYLNSLVHQSLSHTGSVNLSVSTEIELEGTLTTQQPVSNINLHVPGMREETGLTYLYDKPLGVFNLDTAPTVNYQQTYYYIATSNWRLFQYYQIDRNSFKFVFNPAIKDEIEIITQKVELYYYKRYQGATQLPLHKEIPISRPTLSNKLTYATRSGYLYHSVVAASNTNGFEIYKFNETYTCPPVASAEVGLCYHAGTIPQKYWSTHYVLSPEKRFVVKAILKFKIKATGREVTMVKSYLPKYNYKQVMNTYY